MNPIRLLIVDDETVFLGTLVNRLKKRGLAPLSADSGQKCLAVMAKEPVDVVVLDIKMPGLDGLEVLAHIKRKYPETEVILLTGHASTPDGVAGIKAGAFDYLGKPVELDHLLEKIKQANEKKIRAQEKAKEADFREKMSRQLVATERLASLGTLATGVAHEINNPLAIIQEWTGWLKGFIGESTAGFPHKKDFELALSKIESAVGRAKRITHELLGMVQKSEDTLVEIDAKLLIEEVLLLIHRQAANGDINVHFQPKAGETPIWTDPYRLRQVLLNLLTNAIQATPRHGNITVTSALGENDILFEIKDSGCGVPKENMDKIFEPFFTTKSTGEGTGLGLYVSRRIVEKLGGTIEVESRVGHGALFRVRLPLCPDRTHEHKETKELKEN